MTALIRENANAGLSYAPVPSRSDMRAAENDIRVILVDDDDDFREAIGGELGDEGFQVFGFRDGAGMFEHFAQGGTGDVIVLDWRMPGVSGLELLGQARRRGIMLPVIFLTGMPATAYESAALDSGAMDFVNKSRGTAILAKRIRLILHSGKRPPEQRRQEIVRCGDLVLRPQVSRAMWKGQDVNLTVVEFNIVSLLVQSAGEYVTYRSIYDCVHHAGFIAGNGEDGYRTNVRSSIKRIRNKFRALDPEFSQIENFLAFGYRWRDAATAEQSTEPA
ncbi:response regulator transcription factor [uncultured Ferrovibrio sp.]|jgi:two-component system response regulator ChvI|uniref:response regulator transcription factor n=1 Tax=uncultured Ferrovibrio sp. TaxID=1576913 RepID=UPI0026353DD1|nr:response regulator transcription factor [uncultured Ferrovibrio sp.]